MLLWTDLREEAALVADVIRARVECVDDVRRPLTYGLLTSLLFFLKIKTRILKTMKNNEHRPSIELPRE